MYVGDHLHGDSAAAREHMGWATATVCEELQGEGLIDAREAWSALQNQGQRGGKGKLGGLSWGELSLSAGSGASSSSSVSSSMPPSLRIPSIQGVLGP